MRTTTTAPRTPGGTTTGRSALTGSELNLVTKAAYAAMAAMGDDVVSPAKVNKIVRRFAKALARARMTFHEFISDEANRDRIGDPELSRVIAYLDPVGEAAVNRVMRARGF